jgi:hypothetical protein
MWLMLGGPVFVGITRVQALLGALFPSTRFRINQSVPSSLKWKPSSPPAARHTKVCVGAVDQSVEISDGKQQQQSLAVRTGGRGGRGAVRSVREPASTKTLWERSATNSGKTTQTRERHGEQQKRRGSINQGAMGAPNMRRREGMWKRNSQIIVGAVEKMEWGATTQVRTKQVRSTKQGGGNRRRRHGVRETL